MTSVTPQAASGVADTLTKVPCMKLRIAPVQDFDKPSPVLHDPLGYRANGRLWLEAGAKVAASPKCAGATGRYSLAIELVSGSLVVPVADDPRPRSARGPARGEQRHPVEVRRARAPPGQQLPAHGTLQAGAATASFPCPVVELGTTEYSARILQQGVYAKAVYDKTVFGLDVDAPASAIVAGLTGTHSSLPASATFEGEGFKPTGNQTTGPIVLVKQGETWALWSKVFYGFDGVLFPLETFGVDHYAGLLWPRVVGTRGGRPFRYSAKLPTSSPTASPPASAT